MKQFQAILLLILVYFYTGIALAAHHKGTAGSIANFIEANRRNREVVLNNPKYDKYAKVFYVYRCNSAYSMKSLKKYIEWPAEAILRSYKGLVAQVSPVEDTTATDEATEQAEKRHQKRRQKKTTISLPNSAKLSRIISTINDFPHPTS